MSNSSDEGFTQRLKRAWPFVAGLAVLAVVAGAFFGATSTSPTPTAVVPAPSAQVAAETPQKSAPDSPVAPKPTLDLNEPSQAEAEAQAQADAIAGQATDIIARPVLKLRGQGTWADGLKTLSEAIANLRIAASKTGLTVDGRPLVAFTETDDNGFHFEAMLPLTRPPEAKTKFEHGVEAGASPAGKALKFQHRGPYEEIDSTYEAITAFLDEKGLDTKNLFVEEYLTELKTSDDDGLEVDIYVFLK
ncbi:transcription activator effector-binding protein [Methylosinus sp. R-45379]|jgi:effector-binding domain-containing protein|uniref:GyrI-like domain-containing protein n=1 Tax=Methylosinus sp. R-45379 TaxID=980563 RepID=UPI0007C898F5|nr:GyrI-like domain-containing protein [Methylosinus sp. R-45379]OAI30803.1 transcription activator effector-binding protein [Methylosinus sp. R-45379]